MKVDDIKKMLENLTPKQREALSSITGLSKNMLHQIYYGVYGGKQIRDKNAFAIIGGIGVIKAAEQTRAKLALIFDICPCCGRKVKYED